MMFVVAGLAIVMTMVLALVRAYRGPSVYDRVLAANMIGTKTVLLISVSGFLTGRPEWLDLAFLYALMNFVGVIAMLRFTSWWTMSGEGEGTS